MSDENIKSQILSNSIFAISKSGTVSLQISSSNVPSIIIYKLNFINFMIFKLLVNVKFANIINIINNKEIIPELLQNECNAKEIYNSVVYFLQNPKLMKEQVSNCNKTLNDIRSKSSSSLYENKYSSKTVLKVIPTLTNICLVVVIKATAPPLGFQKVNSPAVGLNGLSNLVYSQVTVTKQLSLHTLPTSCASGFSKIRSTAKPSSPPCPK